MAWTASVKCDSDKPDVGLATMVWNAGQADEFVWSKRIKLTHAKANAFVTAGEAARLNQADVLQRNVNLTNMLQAKCDAL